MLVFCLERCAVHPNSGVKHESWFNGWPAPDDPRFAEVVKDNAEFNSDILPFGPGEEGVRKWFEAYWYTPVASFMSYDPSVEYKTVSRDEITTEKYIYPILLHGGGMLNYRSFAKFGFVIDPRVLEDCRTGQAKILVHELNEGHGFNTGELRVFLERQAELLNVPISAIGFVDGNYKTPELQATYGSKGFCMFHWENHSPLMEKADEEARLQTIRRKAPAKYHFISLNRRVRQHRVYLVLNILNRWKDKTLVSCDTFLDNPEAEFANPQGSPFKNLMDTGLLTPEIYKQLPLKIDFDFSVNDTFVRRELQEQAYIALTSETMFFERNTQFFSEKIFKPLIFMQPFILVGPAGSLQILRDMGYLTFEPFIDESYDREEDPQKRMTLILSEIDRLSKATDGQMRFLVRNMLPILRHNLATIKRRRETHIKEKQLVAELEAWVNGN